MGGLVVPSTHLHGEHEMGLTNRVGVFPCRHALVVCEGPASSLLAWVHVGRWDRGLRSRFSLQHHLDVYFFALP
jgi:hypothetical protein